MGRVLANRVDEGKAARLQLECRVGLVNDQRQILSGVTRVAASDWLLPLSMGRSMTAFAESGH